MNLSIQYIDRLLIMDGEWVIGNSLSLGNLSKETRRMRASGMLLDESQRLEGHLVEMGLEGKKNQD